MTADDQPYSVALNIDAPPSPDYVLELAASIAEAVRVLNHQTRHHEALEFPSEADRIIREISSAASRLPQLLQQVSRWLNDEYADGRIRMTGGEFPQSVLAVMAVEARLEKAAEHAGALAEALTSAASVTSNMAQEGGTDD